MSKNLIGAIFTAICILSVGVMVILMTAGVENSWLAVFIGGIIAIIFLMIANAIKDDKKEKKK